EIERLLVCEHHFIAEISRLQLLFIDLRRSISGPVILVFLRQEQLCCTGLETLDDVVRHGVHELDYVSLRQQFLAEGIQPLQFPSAAVRSIRFLANPRRELAAHDGRKQKCKKGDPILRIGHGESSERRQKVTVEEQNRRHGHEKNNCT